TVRDTVASAGFPRAPGILQAPRCFLAGGRACWRAIPRLPRRSDRASELREIRIHKVLLVAQDKGEHGNQGASTSGACRSGRQVGGETPRQVLGGLRTGGLRPIRARVAVRVRG